MTKKFSWLLESWAEKARVPESEPPRSLCELRGRCGPFVNQAYFETIDAAMRMGMCVECGRLVPIPRGDRTFERLDRWLGDGHAEAVAVAL